MNVLKGPSFFRPTSRPSSPAPVLQPRIDTPNASDRPARPHNKLSLSSLIRQPSNNSGQSYQPAPLIQDGSYLEMLSLKLSEAVSKALAQPAGVSTTTEVPAGKRPIPQGRGHALGSLIVSELNNSAHDPHIHRAVLRTLQRPLTVLLTNLSAQLMPSLASPLFHAIPTAINSHIPFPNTVQQHALSIAKFAEEFLQAFDQLGLGLYSDARGDGLKPIRDGLNSVITRVTNPLVATIRNEMVPLVEALESAHHIQQAKAATGTKATIIYHPSIVSLATLVPVYARALTSFTTSVLSHATLANLLISVLWKALVALSHRVDAKPSPLLTPQPSPLLPVKKRRGSPPSTTPPITPPPSRFMLKLPPSRPPSPPSAPTVANAAADCKALYDLLVLFPKPNADHESTRLAREAVDEAFEGLRTLPALLTAANNTGQSEVQDYRALVRELNSITTEIPTLIALPILLHAFGGPGTSSVASLLSLSEEEYRKACMSGFARAEDCAVAIVKRLISALQGDPHANQVLLQWLEMELIEIEGTA